MYRQRYVDGQSLECAARSHSWMKSRRPAAWLGTFPASIVALVLRGASQSSRGMARALAAFALVAMLVRAIVPAGYMFAPVQDGRLITVTLCSAHGGAEVVMDLTTGAIVDSGKANGDPDPSEDRRTDAPCVFATVAHMAAPDSPSSLPLAYRIATTEIRNSIASTPGRGLAAPPPFSTGPPIQA